MILYKDVFLELDARKIRYLVAGGFAVVFHDVIRATLDLDLIIHLDEENVLAFDDMMVSLGFRPRLPVSGKDFAVEENRKKWIAEKNLVVFTYLRGRTETVDIFAQEPLPFDELYARRKPVEALGIEIPVLGLDDLLRLKRAAGRDKDLFDLKQLEKKRDD